MHFRWMGVPLAVLAVVVLLGPSLLASEGSTTGNAATLGAIAPPGTRTESLILDTGNNTSSSIFGVTISPRANLLPNEADLLNATLDRTIVWPGAVAGDNYNPFNDTSVFVAGKRLIWSPAPTNVTEFSAFCRLINCTPILQVPGEIDNPQFAKAIVECAITPITSTCTNPDTGGQIPGWGLRPAYWEIGNEPGLWNDWGLAWPNWTKSANLNPLPSGYGAEVEQYIQNITPIDPNFQVIGLPGLGKGISGNSGTWINAVINDTTQNGSAGNVAGYAIHVYPGGDLSDSFNNTTGNYTPPPVSAFYGLLSQSNPNSAYERAYEQINGLCAPGEKYKWGCKVTSFPLFITELGTSLSHQPLAPYSLGFPGALGAADEDIQMLEFPSSVLTSTDLLAAVFDTNNSWINLSGVARPIYALESQVINHLGSDAFPITTGDPTLEAIATVDRADADRHDLLVVNTNVNNSIRFSSNFITLGSGASINPSAVAAAFSPSFPVAEWNWSGVNTSMQVNQSNSIPKAIYNTSKATTPGPQFVGTTIGLPSTITLPPQSLALFESYNAPAFPVNFTESGLNLSLVGPTPRWFLDINGTHTASNQPSLTLLLPSGRYSAIGPPVLAPQPGSELAPGERFAPQLHSPLIVGTAPVSVTFGFTMQWRVNVTWNSSQGLVTATDPGTGSRIAVPNWWANNSSLLLQVSPNSTYAFSGWYGRGAGSKGLQDENGSISGYALTLRVMPTGPMEETPLFLPGYEVNFSETGLPTGTTWNASLRDLNRSTSSSILTFYEFNNTPSVKNPNPGWSYGVSNVTVRNLTTGNLTTYRFDRSVPSVMVDGAAVNIPVNFAELYPITFKETGLPAGTPWSVLVAGGTSVAARGSSDTSSVQVSEAAGDWGFNVPEVIVPGTPEYRVVQVLPNGTHVPSPAGNVSLPNASATVTLEFIELTPPAEQFLVTFTESTLPANATWSMTFFNGTLQAVASTESTRVYSVINSTLSPTGAWFYNVSRAYLPNGSGFRALNSAGNVSVDGSAVSVTLDFVPLTPPASHYLVTFYETDLPANATWSVNRFVNATLQPISRTESSIVYSVVNGTWFYNISRAYLPNDSVYLPVNSTGTVTVAGHDVSVLVVFTPGWQPAPHFLVTFSESGLPSDASWSLTFFNSTLQPVSSTQSTRVYSVVNSGSSPNGSWFYHASRAFASNGTGYRPLNSTGNVTVEGAPVTVGIQYVPLLPRYPVTFSVTGLPSGDSYEIRLSSLDQVSQVASIGFTIPKGNWTYDIMAPANYFAFPSHGNLSMQGKPMVVTIAFLPLGKGPNPPFLTLALPAATTAVVLILSGLGMFSLLGAIRRRRT